MRAPQFVEGVYLVDVAGAPTAARSGRGAATRVHDRRAGTTTGVAAPAQPTEPAERGRVAPRMPDEAEVWGALVIGLRDYVAQERLPLGRARHVRRHRLGRRRGASPPTRSAATNVYGVSMPSAYSSEHSRTDAADLAERIGAHYREVPIAPMVDAFVAALQLTGLAEENVQARVRGTTLMALSNAEGHLVLATGNKSELAVGYSTIYGDAVGGFAPIKDVPKTLVWALARWRNADAESRGETPPIPPNSITKPPSAELRPGQLDSDSLPDYELLDAILERYVDGDRGVDEIVADGLRRRAGRSGWRGWSTRAEWKRRQYPPGPKISFKAFGRDRRLPITNRWRESAS